MWQFGGYGENNASNSAYQFGVGADFPTSGKDVLWWTPSTAMALALAPGSNGAFGMPIPPFLPQILTATISDNTAAIFVAKYTTGPLKLYAGYEYIHYAAPSDPQTAFTDIAGNFLCQRGQTFNSTNINNAAFGVNGLGNRVLQVMWIGAKYAVTDDLDVIGAYYHYIQNSFFGTPLEVPPSAPPASMRNALGRMMRFLPQWIGDLPQSKISVLA